MIIGLYGGTFDPIHFGHLFLSEWIREKLMLDKIIFIPAYIPPHKQIQEISHADHRSKMVAIAIEDNPFFEISSYEIEKRNISYSIETIMHFRRKYHLSANQLYFFIGSDSLMDFETWHMPNQILGNSRVVVYRRFSADFSTVRKEYLEKVMLVDNPLIEISSSEIRRRVAKGLSIKYMVSPKVGTFIHAHSLYEKKS